MKQLARRLCLVLLIWLMACAPDSEPIEVTRVGVTAIPTTPIPSLTSPTTTPFPTTVPKAAVLTPTPTTLPSPTPFPELIGTNSSNAEYRVAWSVPIEWSELSQQWPPITDDTELWQVWASHPEAISLLAEVPPILTDGAMVFFLRVKPADMPMGEAATSVWGQDIWRNELAGEASAPFAWYEQASLWREPYLYTFSLGCLPSADMTAEDGLAFCRYTWDFYAHTFGLCAQPAPTIPQPGMWQTVQSDWYGYSFEVPEGWYDDSGPTADRVTYFSHPVHQQPYPACPAPEGTMKLEFSADYVDVTDGNWTAVDPIADRPTWQNTGIVVENEQFHATTKVLAIQGKKSWYHIAFYCNQLWTADCEVILAHWQSSFVVKP